MPEPKCPICGARIGTVPARVRPFCSVRCAEVDLGRWFGGTYRISGPPAELEDDEAPRSPSPA